MTSMISRLILAAVDFYVVLILIYVVMSWIPSVREGTNAVYEALSTICEPYLMLFRKIIPPAGVIDFSPVVAVVVLQLIVRLIVFLL